MIVSTVTVIQVFTSIGECIGQYNKLISLTFNFLGTHGRHAMKKTTLRSLLEGRKVYIVLCKAPQVNALATPSYPVKHMNCHQATSLYGHAFSMPGPGTIVHSLGSDH